MSSKNKTHNALGKRSDRCLSAVQPLAPLYRILRVNHACAPQSRCSTLVSKMVSPKSTQASLLSFSEPRLCCVLVFDEIGNSKAHLCAQHHRPRPVSAWCLFLEFSRVNQRDDRPQCFAFDLISAKLCTLTTLSSRAPAPPS